MATADDQIIVFKTLPINFQVLYQELFKCLVCTSTMCFFLEICLAILNYDKCGAANVLYVLKISLYLIVKSHIENVHILFAHVYHP